jgi:Escherichia/Staphylococcus phage prohead protease
MLHRTFPMKLERSGDGRTLEGCCVPYGEAARVTDDGVTTYYEVFEPGAFTRNLKAPGRVELRFEHGERMLDIVGRAQELTEEASGLYGSFRVFNGHVGDHALTLVEEGVLPGLSVGFVPKRRGGERITAEGTVVREFCHLAEVSLCRSPAYDRAVVTAVRSAVVMRNELELPPVTDDQIERLRAIGIEV